MYKKKIPTASAEKQTKAPVPKVQAPKMPKPASMPNFSKQGFTNQAQSAKPKKKK